jgi:hypothetical protein
MAEFYDPQRALTEDWRTFCTEQSHVDFEIPTLEGNVVLPGRRLLLCLMLTMPLIKRLRPLSQKHLLLDGIYGAKSHSRIVTEVARSLEAYGYSRGSISHDLIMTVNDAFNMCYTHLGGHIQSIDIFKIGETLRQPLARETLTMSYGDLETSSTKGMEDRFKFQSAEAIALLSDDTLPINAFRTQLKCNVLKAGQFAQFIVSAGPRTDTDEHVLYRPVFGSFLSGLVDIKDWAIESRSAAKAKHYNKSQMQDAQYFNRRVHLQNSTIWHLYPGDCGTTMTMTYVPTAKTVACYRGKYFVRDGALVELTDDLFDTVIDQEVQFRDVMGCLHTDGYCEACGGTITQSFSPFGNIGFLANVNTGAPIAQMVLSTKHLLSTSTAVYSIPMELSNYFRAEDNNIYMRPVMERKKEMYAIGFVPKDIAKVRGIQHSTIQQAPNASHFSRISYISLGIVQEDGTIKKIAARQQMVESGSKSYPHLSPEILSLIKKHPGDIINQDNWDWLVLKNVPDNTPLMQCVVVNDSILNFVHQFKKLILSDAVRHTSMNTFMEELTGLIWQRVPTHLTHISCLARSCMITDKRDFHIPVMTNPDNVMFGTLSRNIMMRSIGGLMAFEGINIAFNRPITYITPKQHSIFDEFMSYSDLVERDRQYPMIVPQNHVYPVQ